MNLEDYSAIRAIIDDIIGVETKQGENLKIAIKNYFDAKSINVKLVAKENMSFNITAVMNEHAKGADTALAKYTKRLKEQTKQLKEKGEFCGVSG